MNVSGQSLINRFTFLRNLNFDNIKLEINRPVIAYSFNIQQNTTD